MLLYAGEYAGNSLRTFAGTQVQNTTWTKQLT